MLKLEVINYKGVTPARPISVEFDKVGGTIGRGDANALVLPDTERIISRMHARISFRAGRYFIEDHGSSTPVIVNGRSLGRGVDAPLSHSDELKIGDYRLRVELQAGRPAPSMSLSQTVVATFASSEQHSGLTEAGAGDATMAVVDALDETRDLLLETQRIRREVVVPAQPLHAFLDGAGIADIDLPANLTPENMHMLGQLMREMVQAMLDMLAARATLKRELHADMTVNPANENNPLKFSPNVEAAMTHLLRPQRGYLLPLQAVKEACNDLRAHQAAIVAGARAALIATLQRINPDQLELRVRDNSLMDTLLPSSRKAKLWDHFAEVYGEMAKQLEGNFDVLWEREFARAYDTQIRAIAHQGPSTRHDQPRE